MHTVVHLKQQKQITHKNQEKQILHLHLIQKKHKKNIMSNSYPNIESEIRKIVELELLSLENRGSSKDTFRFIGKKSNSYR